MSSWKKRLPCSPCFTMLFEIIRNAVPCFPCFSMLFEVMKIRSYHAPHSFPCCLKSWENNAPCFPCFSMLFKIIRRWCPMVSMLIPCSADVAWKYSHAPHASPCFCRAWESMGSMGKPWSPHEFHAFSHAFYTRVLIHSFLERYKWNRQNAWINCLSYFCETGYKYMYISHSLTYWFRLIMIDC